MATDSPYNHAIIGFSYETQWFLQVVNISSRRRDRQSASKLSLKHADNLKTVLIQLLYISLGATPCGNCRGEKVLTLKTERSIQWEHIFILAARKPFRNHVPFAQNNFIDVSRRNGQHYIIHYYYIGELAFFLMLLRFSIGF